MYDNPHYQQWTGLQDFFVHARKYYNEHKDIYDWDYTYVTRSYSRGYYSYRLEDNCKGYFHGGARYRVNVLLADRLYVEARASYSSPCTRYEFIRYLVIGVWPWRDNTIHPSGTWRRKKKYVRDTRTSKKVLTEEEKQKREWKRSKKRESKSWDSNRKAFAKDISARRHRRFEKQCIHHERYDDLHSETDRLFFDPWIWD